MATDSLHGGKCSSRLSRARTSRQGPGGGRSRSARYAADGSVDGSRITFLPARSSAWYRRAVALVTALRSPIVNPINSAYPSSSRRAGRRAATWAFLHEATTPSTRASLMRRRASWRSPTPTQLVSPGEGRTHAPVFGWSLMIAEPLTPTLGGTRDPATPRRSRYGLAG